MNLFDFRPTSGWIPRIYTYAQIIANPVDHPLFQTNLIHCNLFMVMLDVMHVVLLGVLLNMLGSALYTLVNDSGLPGNIDARIRASGKLATLAGPAGTHV